MNFNDFIENSKKLSHSYIVDDDVYFAFQRCSKDFNPLHTDNRWAKNMGYNECVMYGNILNSFVSHFVGMLLPSKNVIIQTQSIAYHKPVYLNDKIELKAEIDSFSESVGVIEYKLKFYKTELDKQILVAKGKVQIGLLKNKQ